MYMDLYLMINDKSIDNYKFTFFDFNKKKSQPIPTPTDNFMKFQWPWLL